MCSACIQAMQSLRVFGMTLASILAGEIYPLAKAVDAIIASNQPARGGKVLIGN